MRPRPNGRGRVVAESNGHDGENRRFNEAATERSRKGAAARLAARLARSFNEAATERSRKGLFVRGEGVATYARLQ